MKLIDDIYDLVPGDYKSIYEKSKIEKVQGTSRLSRYNILLLAGFPSCLWTLPRSTTRAKSGQSKWKSALVPPAIKDFHARIVMLVTHGLSKVFT